MSERLNFICVGDRLLAPHEHRQCIETIASCIVKPGGDLLEVMRMDGAGVAEVVLPWMRASEVLEALIDEDALLTAYFAVKGDEATARQSITLEASQNSTVVTVSLDPVLMADLADASWRLAALAGWAMETFDTAVLACGAELDLYEVGHEANPRHVEERLSSDSRCRYVMTARRLVR